MSRSMKPMGSTGIDISPKANRNAPSGSRLLLSRPSGMSDASCISSYATGQNSRSGGGARTSGQGVAEQGVDASDPVRHRKTVAGCMDTLHREQSDMRDVQPRRVSKSLDIAPGVSGTYRMGSTGRVSV